MGHITDLYKNIWELTEMVSDKGKSMIHQVGIFWASWCSAVNFSFLAWQDALSEINDLTFGSGFIVV